MLFYEFLKCFKQIKIKAPSIRDIVLYIVFMHVFESGIFFARDTFIYTNIRSEKEGEKWRHTTNIKLQQQFEVKASPLNP